MVIGEGVSLGTVGNPVELLPVTPCGLGSSASDTSNPRKTLTLSDDIVNYRFLIVYAYTTLSSVERRFAQIIATPFYTENSQIAIGLWSDSNTSYYCYSCVSMSGTSFNIYRTYYSNYSAPKFQVIGIP